MKRLPEDQAEREEILVRKETEEKMKDAVKEERARCNKLHSEKIRLLEEKLIVVGEEGKADIEKEIRRGMDLVNKERKRCEDVAAKQNRKSSDLVKKLKSKIVEDEKLKEQFRLRILKLKSDLNLKKWEVDRDSTLKKLVNVFQRI